MDDDEIFDLDDSSVMPCHTERFRRLIKAVNVFMGVKDACRVAGTHTACVTIDAEGLLGRRTLQLYGLAAAPVRMALEFVYDTSAPPNRPPFKAVGGRLWQQELAASSGAGNKFGVLSSLTEALNNFLRSWNSANSADEDLASLVIQEEALRFYKSDVSLGRLDQSRVSSLLAMTIQEIESSLSPKLFTTVRKVIGEDIMERWATHSCNVVIQSINFVRSKLFTCAKQCVNCGAELSYPSFRPSICDNTLCHFQYEQLGLGLDLGVEMANQPDVADLLLSVARMQFSNEQRGVAIRDLDSLPPVDSLAKLVQRRMFLPILLPIYVNNKCLIEALSSEERVKGIPTEHQFLMLSGGPEKINRFLRLKQEAGSVYGLFGIDIPYFLWHALFSRGLGVAAEQADSARVHEESFKLYSRLTPNTKSWSPVKEDRVSWENSHVKANSNCTFLLLCEIIRGSDLKQKKEVLELSRPVQRLLSSLGTFSGPSATDSTEPPTSEQIAELITMMTDHALPPGANINNANPAGPYGDAELRFGRRRRRSYDEDVSTFMPFLEHETEASEESLEERYFEVPDEEHILTRYLFYFPTGLRDVIDLERVTIADFVL